MAEIFKLLNSASSKLMHNKNLKFKDIDMCMIRNRNNCRKKVSLIFFQKIGKYSKITNNIENYKLYLKIILEKLCYSGL